ncbi:hypothetical protein N4741_18785 [Escherichia coli]|nr:hypothetical protein [Escherichia coli]MCU6850579.1 hypothetical protein [Escherichia coli]MCU7044703.1 hypothetical protein [Escherichia coli]
MSTITREWLQQAINDYESVRDELPFGLDDYQGNILAALRIALASLEAEPVAWKVTFTQIDREYNTFTAMYSDKAEAERWVRLHKVGDFRAEITPLYAAPPAMVVPDEMDLLTCHLDGVTETYADGWNACRAAMLQAEPVSNSDELPLDYLQGHKDGLEWAAQLAEANHPQTGDWLYDDPIDLARAIRKGPDMPTVQGGSSPVIPDDVRRMDWLVSKTVDVREPMVYGSHSLFWSQTITDEEDDYHATKLREQIDAAMAAEQAAAPQQEVNRG